jgi:hypothetical protein
MVIAAHPDFLWKFQRRPKSPQPFSPARPTRPVVPFPPHVKQPRPPPTTSRSAATLLTSGHRLASRAPPLHLKWRYRPILSPPLPFTLPPFPPPLETAPSIAAGRAPTACHHSSFPDPSLRRPDLYKAPRGSPNHAIPLPLLLSLSRRLLRAPTAELRPPPWFTVAGLTPSTRRPLSPTVRTPRAPLPFPQLTASSHSPDRPQARALMSRPLLPCSGPWWTESAASPRARGHGSWPFAFRNNSKSNNSCSFSWRPLCFSRFMI